MHLFFRFKGHQLTKNSDALVIERAIKNVAIEPLDLCGYWNCALLREIIRSPPADAARRTTLQVSQGSFASLHFIYRRDLNFYLFYHQLLFEGSSFNLLEPI